MSNSTEEQDRSPSALVLKRQRDELLVAARDALDRLEVITFMSTENRVGADDADWYHRQLLNAIATAARGLSPLLQAIAACKEPNT